MQIDEMDLSMIRNMMLTKSPKAIAKTMGLPVAPVQEAVLTMYQELGIEFKWPAVADKTQNTEQQPKPRKPKAKEPKITSRVIRKEDPVLKQIQANRRQRSEFKMESRQIDYSSLVSVRVDQKTWIMVKPGQEQKAASAFKKNYRTPMDKFND
jgi:hypothetical protein